MKLYFQQYWIKSGIARKRVKEGDLVAARIASVLDSPGYPLKPTSLMVIHKCLLRHCRNN